MTGSLFDAIYLTNAWQGVDSRSGPGAGVIPTRWTAEALRTLVVVGDIQSVLDVGCGDGTWMPDLPGYLGLDVSPVAVQMHRLRHPGRDVRVWDGSSPLPQADLVICRFVIQHLSPVMGEALTDMIVRSRPRLMAITTYRDGVNVDIQTAMDDGRPTSYRPDMRRDPFDLGEPQAIIPDGWNYLTGDTIADQDVLLGVWRGRP